MRYLAVFPILRLSTTMDRDTQIRPMYDRLGVLICQLEFDILNVPLCVRIRGTDAIESTTTCQR